MIIVKRDYAAQRKVEGRAAFGASLSNAMLCHKFTNIYAKLPFKESNGFWLAIE